MIICAAVKIHLIKENRDVIIHCMRHHYAYEIIRDLNISVNNYFRVEEGFINHKGEFLTRAEAYTHAAECGQVCAQIRYDKQKKEEKELFSEDLW